MKPKDVVNNFLVKYRTKRGATRWAKVKAQNENEAENIVFDNYDASIIINIQDAIYKRY